MPSNARYTKFCNLVRWFNPMPEKVRELPFFRFLLSLGAPPRCHENAMFVPCASPCPPTCENPRTEPCAKRCDAGCTCLAGFVKRKDGECVRPEQCEQRRCGEDEQFYECTPSCKNTCANHNKPGVRCGCGPPGCFCREGLVKRADGKCVTPRQCPRTPPKCRENAMFVPCSSPCPPTCEHPRPQSCTQQACDAGCICLAGFVKRKDGECIRPEQCEQMRPTRCRENAVFLPCGPACPPTCQNPKPGVCTTQCIAGCFCNPGFLKDKNGRCLRPEQCNKSCRLPEEEFLECGSTCPDTCENRGQPPPSQCPYRCNRGCFCKKGLFRTRRGACVLLKDCPDERTQPVPGSRVPVKY